MMADAVIRIVLVDDHIKVHRAIAAAVGVWDDLELVGQGSNGIEAIQLCEEHTPDVVLMDVVMPGMDGIEATRVITERFPQIKVLALSSFQDEESVRSMLDAGAVGYLLKNSSIDDLAQTIRTAYRGTAVFSAEVTQVLLRSAAPTSAAPHDYGLTPREGEVLRLMVEGLNNRQIAEALVVSQSTAKFHVSRILAKLDVESRVEAVALAVEQKLVT
jgi:NarL family two-component system response regulator LiaR